MHAVGGCAAGQTNQARGQTVVDKSPIARRDCDCCGVVAVCQCNFGAAAAMKYCSRTYAETLKLTLN